LTKKEKKIRLWKNKMTANPPSAGIFVTIYNDGRFPEWLDLKKPNPKTAL